MIRTGQKKPTTSATKKSNLCSKVNCHRALPLNHPRSYTNGLCHEHFLSIDLPSSDDDDGDNEINDNLPNEPKEKHVHFVKTQDQPLRGDIRKRYEVFDGHQWCIFEQKTDPNVLQNNTDSRRVTTRDSNTDSLLQLVQLLTNYQAIHDELKK